MKVKPTTSILFLGILTASGVLVGAAHSAGLVVGKSLIIASQNHSSNKGSAAYYNVSLNAAKAAFAAINHQTTEQVDAPDFNVAFTEAIQGYPFVITKPANTIDTLVSKGVSVSATTTDKEFDSFGTSPAKLWVTSNPGTDLEKPATSPDCRPGASAASQMSADRSISQDWPQERFSFSMVVIGASLRSSLA